MLSFPDVASLISVLGNADSETTYDEPISLLSHSLQTAEHLRGVAPNDVELQIAGLLHDVGHLDRTIEVERHPAVGARAIAPLLGPRVADLVALHAEAKRYLTTTDASYLQRLSPRSIETLALEGGLMTDLQVRHFAQNEYAHDACLLRRSDDIGKSLDPPTTCLEDWVEQLHSLERH